MSLGQLITAARAGIGLRIRLRLGVAALEGSFASV